MAEVINWFWKQVGICIYSSCVVYHYWYAYQIQF